MAEFQGSDSEQAVLRRKSAETDAKRATPPEAAHPLWQLQSQIGNAQVARLLAQRAEEDNEDKIQAAHDTVGIEGGPVPPNVKSEIESTRGGGSTLPDSTRAQMESSFKTSFEDVRVHQDQQSTALNQQLTARAFTTGSDIYLRGDVGASDTHLLAHELSHVVQQRSMGSGGGQMQVGAAGDQHEQAADAIAQDVTSGGGVAQRAVDDDENAGAG